jgi:nitroimidazol reductase NimA-like FMN-containing flavoprotein (pyridoxamine 5'-phosphate oxidase superfamily)
MIPLEERKSALARLLADQRFAVLSTLTKDGIHSCLIAFAADDALRSLFLCTPKATRKYTNLRDHPNVTMLVHNSSNQGGDITQAMAASIAGRAREVDAAGRLAALERFLSKHPHMAEFARTPSVAIIEVQIDRFDLVTHFQDVAILHVKDLP